MTAAERWGPLLVIGLMGLEVGIAFYYLVWFVSSVRAVRTGGDAIDRGMVHTNAAQLAKKLFYVFVLGAIHILIRPMPDWLVWLLAAGVIIDLYFAGAITYLMLNLLKGRLAAIRGHSE